MKKTMLFLFSLLLLMSGCNNEDLDQYPASKKQPLQLETVRWYGTKLADSPQTKGVADGYKLWNQNAGINIKFLNNPSDPAMVSRIRQIAAEWELYAGIQFNFVDQSVSAPVRIAFDWNGNDWLTWSYTGTDARYVRSQNEPTAVFGGLEYLSESEFRGDVLRVFGQILGLEYEQRHQEWAANGYWKTTAQLQSYWEAQFEGLDMDWDEIREYVFDPLTEANALLYQTREIDELSIMAWPYYNRMQTTKLLANYELSESDKEFIGQLYPREEVILPTIQEAWVDAGFFTWKDATKTSLVMTRLGTEQEYLPDVSDGQQLTSVEYMFTYNSSHSITKLIRAPKFNTSNVTDFSYMFYGCNAMTSIPLYDTSKGTSFAWMFAMCNSLESIPLLDTSNGTNFYLMFSGCRSLTSVPLLDTSKGTNFEQMFAVCTSLTSIPHLNTSNGTNFKEMFRSCQSITTIPLLDLSNATTLTAMLNFCTSLTSIPLLNTSNVTNFSSMFVNCESLTTIPLLDTSNGIYMGMMFANCYALTDVPSLDTSNNTTFLCMFSGCSSLTTIPYLDTSNSLYFDRMFEYCTSLTHIPQLDTSNGISFPYMFRDCSALQIKPQLDLSNAIYTTGIFAGTPFG